MLVTEKDVFAQIQILLAHNAGRSSFEQLQQFSTWYSTNIIISYIYPIGTCYLDGLCLCHTFFKFRFLTRSNNDM